MSPKTLFLLFLLCPALTRAACISPSEAAHHIGETKCVSGKVDRVEQGTDGSHFLHFCGDSASSCAFIAVIFADDLRHIGDVRHLKDKMVEVHGELKEYDSHPEIIVSEAWQLKGEATRIPPLPKSYDVERKGQYSPGIFSHPKTYSASKKRKSAKLPVMIPADPAD